MTRQEWQEEIVYCAGVVRKGGDRNVPRGAVASYLDLQANSARREGETDVVDKLDSMREAWSAA